MKHLTILIVAVLAACLVGCSADSATQWAQQRETLTTFVNTMGPVVASGKLTPAEVDLADTGVLAMRAALNDAGHVDANGKFIVNNAGGFKADLDIAKAVAKRLADTYLAVPATQPSK